MRNNKIAVSILFAVNGFLFANYVSRLPRIQTDYGLDNGSIGLVLLASALGALLAMPFTGWLIVGSGSRKIAAISGLSFCLVIPMIGLMPGAWFLGVLFFLMGLSTGTMDVSMNAQAVMAEKAHKQPIMSFFHAMFSAGMMAGAGTGALFTKFDYGLRIHLMAVSVLAVSLIIWAILNLIKDQGVKIHTGNTAFRLPQASLLGVGVIAFCCMLGEGAMANWSTNYMLKVAHAESSLAPLGLAIFSLAMMLARFSGDKVRSHLGDRKLLIFSSMTAVTGLGMVLLFPYPFLVLAGLLMVGLGLSVIVPIAYSTAGNTPGLSPGVGIGMVTTIGYGGLLLGPPIIGFLADWQNLRIALLFALLLFALMTILSFYFRPVSESNR